MKRILALLLCFFATMVVAQEANFREDQLYFSIAYPYFSTPPQGLIQNKLSYSLSAGFVRDIPINKTRRLAIGLGLGWDKTTVFTNTRFQAVDGSINASVLQEDVTRNSLQVQSVAIPLVLRWRNATEQKHAFWRIHSGISLHFPFNLKTTFEGQDGVETREFLPHEQSLLRWNLHFGFNTWNISIVHDLQPWTSVTHLGKNQDIKFTKIGLIFYLF